MTGFVEQRPAPDADEWPAMPYREQTAEEKALVAKRLAENAASMRRAMEENTFKVLLGSQTTG